MQAVQAAEQVERERPGKSSRSGRRTQSEGDTRGLWSLEDSGQKYTTLLQSLGSKKGKRRSWPEMTTRQPGCRGEAVVRRQDCLAGSHESRARIAWLRVADGRSESSQGLVVKPRGRARRYRARPRVTMTMMMLMTVVMMTVMRMMMVWCGSGGGGEEVEGVVVAAVEVGVREGGVGEGGGAGGGRQRIEPQVVVRWCRKKDLCKTI